MMMVPDAVRRRTSCPKKVTQLNSPSLTRNPSGFPSWGPEARTEVYPSGSTVKMALFSWSEMYTVPLFVTTTWFKNSAAGANGLGMVTLRIKEQYGGVFKKMQTRIKPHN